MYANAEHFAHYEQAPTGNRLVLAAAFTILAMATTGAALLTIERLQIERVAPPKGLEAMLVMPGERPATPTPKPPAQPESQAAAASAAQADTPTRNTGPKSESVDAESADLNAPAGLKGDPFARPGGSGIPGISKGPIGVPTGGGGDPPRPPVKTKAPLKLKQGQLGCLACADPSRDVIRRSAQAGFKGGRNITSFCVDERGRVNSVTTKRSSGDPRVDATCRSAVKRWRMRPYKVGGQPRRACTQAQFDIQMR